MMRWQRFCEPPCARIILGGDLMENLDHDLDEFLDDLLKE